MTEWDDSDVLADKPYRNGREPGSVVPPPAVEKAVSRVFATLEDWVSEWFAPVFARDPGPDRRWCAMWWDHEEAIHRLYDLWVSWEALRLRADLGMSTWLREHLDPQRDRLMAEGGPFQSCDKDQHNRPPALPVTPAPQGWWEMAPAERRSYR